MSWSANVEIPKGSSQGEVRGLLNTAQVTGNEGEERDKAVDQARNSVIDILASGVIGQLTEHGFRVSMSGHSNPGNKPVDGWSNDMLTISIYQTE